MASTQPTFPKVAMPVRRELLDAALAFRAAQPWTLLNDSDNFALIDDHQRPWFPSVLGAAGQVFGLVLYRGTAGLRFLLETSRGPDVVGPDVRFLQDALMLDWGSKKFLDPEELGALKQLGYAPKARERNAWPCFRTHSPGWYPWFPDESEARELTAGIWATLACVELVRRDPRFFAPADQKPDLLPTVPMRDALGGSIRPDLVEWRRWPVPALDQPPAPQFSPARSAALLAQPLAQGLVMEFDVFHHAVPIAEGGRPLYPRVSLMVDGRNGFVYAVELVGPAVAWTEIVLAAWERAIMTARHRPEFISIDRAHWFPALAPLASALGVRLLLQESLPRLAEARASLEQFANG